jgi:serine/threonine protein kinase
MSGDAQSSGLETRPTSSAASAIRADDEPIPGYRLIEPLGKGGFGEVWKCQAPGGFLKAIKFVRGGTSADESQSWLAEQELKAIDLIKNIRHPFILTVERAEVQRSTLMIVMELADRNMQDLLMECEGRGLRGIPRGELLRYLSEAAEALDLMNFEHGLQHLDVKPQNLFLVGGHLKVADFGLVNRLPDPKAADTAAKQGVGGITPRYVAPEILQHHISRRSDQYSLAIVYQELLTGQVPFKGRSGRELFLQHMQARPDLSPLPEADRDVVAQALAKDPEERFASCRDLVRALTRMTPTVIEPTPSRTGSSETSNARRTDTMVRPKGKISLQGFTYQKLLGQTPLGEVWEVQGSTGETRWAFHLQGFALEDAAEQEKALTYLQTIRQATLLRFKVGAAAPHRIILIYEPWGPSLGERCRTEKLGANGLLRALAEAAHAVDELTALTNLEHLGLSPETVVQGLDGEQLRDFGLIALLWKSRDKPLDMLNPRYCAPELAQGRAWPASDQYSLAATYADLRTFELTRKLWHVAKPGTKSRAAAIDLTDIPGTEREVLGKALDWDPGRRFSTCVDMINALAQARGGTASQTTTAVHSALAATQATFLTALDDWIGKQPGGERGAAVPSASPAAAADGSLRHTCIVEIVPGTAGLRLEVFQQEWNARVVAAAANEFLFFLPLEGSFWQRLRSVKVGVEVHVALEPLDAKSSTRCRATIVVRPLNCNAGLTRHVNDTLVPALLNSLLQCLNVLADRRREKRLPCKAEVTIRQRAPGCQPTEHPAELVNVSRNGIGLITTTSIRPGTEIRMVLSLPQKDEQPQAILLKAIVKRCEALPDGRHDLGAEFVHEEPKPE